MSRNQPRRIHHEEDIVADFSVGSGTTAALADANKGGGRIVVKVVDIFGNDTMTIVEVSVGKIKRCPF